jgi:hypothetical protein
VGLHCDGGFDGTCLLASPFLWFILKRLFLTTNIFKISTRSGNLDCGNIMNHAFVVIKSRGRRKQLGINRRAWDDYPTYLWKRSAPKQRLRLGRTAQFGIVHDLELFAGEA